MVEEYENYNDPHSCTLPAPKRGAKSPGRQVKCVILEAYITSP